MYSLYKMDPMQQYLEKFNITRNYLIMANFLLGLFLVLLSNLKVIPLGTSDLTFFSVLSLVFALYRPGWALLFFVGLIGFETINLVPEKLGIAIRPYQLLGILTVLAVAIRLISGRLNFELSKIKRYDLLVVILIIASFLSALFSEDSGSSLKLSLILAIFSVFYFLARNYIQTPDDLKKIVPFFISSAIVIVGYGIWQNSRFTRGLASFEVMPGRPNATFSEADWLGIYLVLLISVIYSLLFYFRNGNREEKPEGQISKSKISIRNFRLASLYLFLTLTFVALILTVSRSAWLGAFFVTVIFLSGVFTDFRFGTWHWKKVLEIKAGILFSLLLALGIVFGFHLTNFQLWSRLESTSSGLQKITISCEDDETDLPGTIADTGELEKFHCRHIDLEDIGSEKAMGRVVREIPRYDPNVRTRNEIYQKSWEQIKKHPVLGIGWGSIGQMLGKDERGTSLNSSNIFIETYLGAGILGFLALISLWLYIFFRSIWKFNSAQNHLSKTIGLFAIISWLAITIPNLFNAGLFLGFLWLWLGIVFIKDKDTN